MPERIVYIAGIGAVSIILIFLTPVISFGMWKFYRMLGVYHPTPADLDNYLEDRPGEEATDYISEGWFEKFGLTFAINFITVGIALILVLIYGLVILGYDMTFSGIFGAGIVVVAVNTSFRIGDMMNLRWGRQRSEGVELLSFGHTFFTSLWVLSALGSTVSVLSGRVPKVIMEAEYSWSVENAVIWGCVFVFFMIIIPFCTEYILAEHVDIDEDVIDFEYEIEALKEMAEQAD
jgi:hypothetical protein